jgi:Trk K+ transport system NAD-binding subunit
LLDLFKEAGESVVLIDTNSEASRLAEVEAVPVLVESALDNNVLENAGLSSATTFLAMTNNGEVNAVIAQQAQQEFQPPRVMAILPEKDAANLSPAKKIP